MSVAQPHRRQMLSPNEAAAYLGYSAKTIRRKVASGELRAYRLPKGREIRIDQADLDKLLRPIPTGGPEAA